MFWEKEGILGLGVALIVCDVRDLSQNPKESSLPFTLAESYLQLPCLEHQTDL